MCLSLLISVAFVTIGHAIGPLNTFGVGVGTPKCEPSVTTASGAYAMVKTTGKHKK